MKLDTNSYIKVINGLINIDVEYNPEELVFKRFLADPLRQAELKRIKSDEKMKSISSQRHDSLIDFYYSGGVYCEFICLSLFRFFEQSPIKAHDLYIREIDTFFEVKNSLYTGGEHLKKSLQKHLNRGGLSKYVIQFLHDGEYTKFSLDGVYQINNYIKGDFSLQSS